MQSWEARREFREDVPEVAARPWHPWTRQYIFCAWLNARVSFSRKWLFFTGRKTVPEKVGRAYARPRTGTARRPDKNVAARPDWGRASTLPYP